MLLTVEETKDYHVEPETDAAHDQNQYWVFEI